MPELQRLLIGDDPQSWQAAGFTVAEGETIIGNIAVRFADHRHTDEPTVDGEPDQPAPGVIGWELTDTEDGSIDGIKTIGVAAGNGASSGPSPGPPPAHRNHVTRMDHVVIMTPDLERTTSSLKAAGFSVRRTRDIPGAEPPRRQAFLWAGETIIEVVGPVSASGSAPAAIWGLALTTDDLDAAAAELGDAITAPKQAVQPGRRIATVKTKDLGISLALALMTPHVPVDPIASSGSTDA